MITLLAISACAGGAQANEQENYLRLSEKLVALRGQVNDLSNELQQRRDEHNIEMKALLSQKSTVDSSIKHEKVAIDNLQQDLLKNKALIKTYDSIRSLPRRQGPDLNGFLNPADCASGALPAPARNTRYVFCTIRWHREQQLDCVPNVDRLDSRER